MPGVVPSNILPDSQEHPTPSLEASANAAEPPDVQPGPGFGYLTVHSSSSTADVYVMLKKYGTVEEKLIVPCGERFVTIIIGTSAQDRKEPIWLAPGRTMQVPCGQSVEVTINPRAFR
jgi:hypothetical protein